MTNGASRFVTASNSPTFVGSRGRRQFQFQTASRRSPTAAARLHVVIAGQTINPGQPPYDGTGGKNHALPRPVAAGSPYTVSVYLTDSWYNPAQSALGMNLNVVTSDPFDTNDPDTSETIAFHGTFTSFSRTFQTANSTGWTVRADDNSGFGMLSSTSSLIVVNPDVTTSDPHSLLVLVDETAAPGNTAAGGKTGTKNPKTAGVAFPVTFLAVDQFWNKVNDNPTITI